MTVLTMEPRSDTRWIRTRAGRVAVDLYGRGGSPVLLLHGLPGWRGTWREVALRLSDQYQVIVPDLLGFGESDDPPSPDSHAADQARMVLELLDILGVSRVHLAGHDFGGPVALTLYRAAPGRTRSLVLANTNAFTDTPVPLPLQIARVRGVGEAAFRVLFGYTGLRLLWHAAVGDKGAFPKTRYEEALRWERGRYWTRRVLLGSLRNLRRVYERVEGILPAVSVPTAVLWGLRDPFFPIDIGRRLADAIPGARLVPLEGCGHFVPEERPDAAATAIRQLASLT